MTVWRKLENDNCYGVAIYSFHPKRQSQLSLDVGELVSIKGETDEWYWGCSLRTNANGAFPKNYVVIRDCNVDKCGDTIIASSGGSGVAHEIAVTLRDWIIQWKRLYVTSNERFKMIEVSMLALLMIRRSVVGATLPQDQLRRERRTALFTIDKGNRLLGLELAVRTESGQLVNPLKTSMFTLNMLHEETNTRIDKNMETTPSKPSSQYLTHSYTLIVRVHNFICRTSDAAELQLAVHGAGGARLTEPLLLHWTRQHEQQALFTDLNADIRKEKTYLVCQVVRLGSMEQQTTDNRRSSIVPAPEPTCPCLRRPHGVAVAEITRLLSEAQGKHIHLPFYACEKDNNLDSLLKKVILVRDMKEAKSQGLWVSIQLVEGDMKQVREEHPHLMLWKTVVANKIGFGEIILPGDARNDLYVTVMSGSFSKVGGKSDRNIELTARVVDRHGEPLQGISLGAGQPLVYEFKSVVYYHEVRPKWQEYFKVDLPIETFKEAHLVFLCRHRSSNEAKDKAEKYFALSYIRLMQKEGTTIADTVHNLCVYKIEHKRSSNLDSDRVASAECLALPSARRELPAGAERGLTRQLLALQHRDALSVATQLCSTKLTQREEILGVLKWNAHYQQRTLKHSLRTLLEVPKEELVKFLQDILDALFCILTRIDEEEALSPDSYSVLVLDCLLRVISVVGDHKYLHFQPLLHVYIDDSFCDALAYEKLLSVMVWTITSADNDDEASLKRLLQCMKCLESLSRFVVRSAQLRNALGDQAHTDAFHKQIENFLEAITWLMRCGDHALTCQGSALKYLPNAIPHIIKVYPATELSRFIVLTWVTLPLQRLSKQRMLSLAEVIRGPLCVRPQCRNMLLPQAAQTIRNMLRDKAEWDRNAASKSRSVDKAARLLGAETTRLQDSQLNQDKVELCIDTLGEIVSLLSRDDIGPVEQDRVTVATLVLPTVVHMASDMLTAKRDSNSHEDAQLRRVISVLLEMVRQLTTEQYRTVAAALEAERPQRSMVASALTLIETLTKRPVFPSHWPDVLQPQFAAILHVLRLLSLTLRDRLTAVDASDTEQLETLHEMWKQWFNAVTAVATASALQLETFGRARIQRMKSLYGDLRRNAAEILSECWQALGEHKQAFIPFVVAPFLEVSFVQDEQVRKTIIPLFYDVMSVEYSRREAEASEEVEPEEHLRELEGAFIDSIDSLCSRGLGDSAWRARFVSLCGAACGRAAPAPRRAAGSVLAAAARQLDTLLQYREAAERSGTWNRMQLITQVLHFYEEIKKPHMYIRYVHKLAQMHHDANQWAEAGLCLRLHAKLLSWSPDVLPPRLCRPSAPPTATQRRLKESLYLEISELLNKGRQWELAIEVIKELVTVYEEEALGYGPLAELHSQLSKLYSAILTTPRFHPHYFRVIYHGKGFPEYLRVPAGFIFRGDEYEPLQEFKERMLDAWPDAVALARLDPPGDEVTEGNGQYLQINAVTPIMGDKLKRLSGKPIAEQILEYYEHNNVNRFEFSRPFHRVSEELGDEDEEQNEFATRWLERTEVEISEKLPGILRWFPVVSCRTYWVSPLEAAVETVRAANRKLRSLILEARRQHASLHPLTMRLQGILDSAVQGGIVNYEKAFLTPSYAARNPSHASLLTDLKDLIADQIPLLKCGLEVHAARASPEMEALHDHLQACFLRMQQHVHHRYGKKDCDLEPEPVEVQLRAPLRDQDRDQHNNHSAHRVSDVSAGGNDSASKSKFFSFNPAINPLIPSSRNSSGGVVGYFNTIQSPKRRNNAKARARKTTMDPTFVVYTSPSTHNVNDTPPAPSMLPSPPNNDATSPLRELTQELTNERPLRAEVEREKRLSQRASMLTGSAPQSNRNSLGTTDSNYDDEEPPPLPQKQRDHIDIDGDHNNNPDTNVSIRQNYDQVCPRGSFLYNSIIGRRAQEKPPTPPPKLKKNIG